MTLQEQVQLVLTQLQSAEAVLTRQSGTPRDLLMRLRATISDLQACQATHTVTSDLLDSANAVHHQVHVWATTSPLHPLVPTSIQQIVQLRHRLFDALEQVVAIAAAPLELCVAIGCVIQEATGLLARGVATAVELALWLAVAHDVLQRVAAYDTVEQEVA